MKIDTILKIKVATNRVGSDDYSAIEIDDEDVRGMSEEKFEAFMSEIAADEIMCNGLVNWTWEVLDE